MRRRPVSRSASRTGWDRRRSCSASALCSRTIGAISRAASISEVSGPQCISLVPCVDTSPVTTLTPVRRSDVLTGPIATPMTTAEEVSNLDFESGPSTSTSSSRWPSAAHPQPHRRRVASSWRATGEPRRAAFRRPARRGFGGGRSVGPRFRSSGPRPPRRRLASRRLGPSEANPEVVFRAVSSRTRSGCAQNEASVQSGVSRAVRTVSTSTVPPSHSARRASVGNVARSRAAASGGSHAATTCRRRRRRRR